MAFHTKKLYYRKNNLNYAVSLYTTAADMGSNSMLAVRDIDTTVYAAIGQTSSPSASHIHCFLNNEERALLFSPNIYPTQDYSVTTASGGYVTGWHDGAGLPPFHYNGVDSYRPLSFPSDYPHCIYFDGSGSKRLIKTDMSARIMGDWTATVIILPMRTIATGIIESTASTGVSYWNVAQNWVLAPASGLITESGIVMNGISVGTNGMLLLETVYPNNWLPRAVKYTPISGSSYSVITVTYKDRRARFYINGTFIHEGVTSTSPFGTSILSEHVGGTSGSTTASYFKTPYMKLESGAITDAQVTDLHSSLKITYGLTY